MPLLSLLSGTLLSLALAQDVPKPADIAAKETRLQKVASDLQQMSDDDFLAVSRGFMNPGHNRNSHLEYFASRSAALGKVYGSLAALEY